jgi:hypothetical protein
VLTRELDGALAHNSREAIVVVIDVSLDVENSIPGVS